MRYLVLAREELSNFVEGRALRTNSTKGVCRIILEDIFNEYGSIGQMRADRGKLDVVEARNFFQRYRVQLRLTKTYNLKANGKSERDHPPITHALIKACKEKANLWPRLLPFALWADRATHSIVTSYMPIELMHGHKPIMPGEKSIPTWVFLSWEDNITIKRLLELCIQQLGRLPKDMEVALERLKAARLGYKERLSKPHSIENEKD